MKQNGSNGYVSVLCLLSFWSLFLLVNIFLIFFARASPSPSTFANSEVVALKTFKGVPNFSSIRTANFSPIPGKLQSVDNC